MQKVLELLNPGFMRKVDRYLLLHYPRLWATRFHYVLLYGVLANALGSLAIIFFLRPNQLSVFAETLVWIIILVEAGVYILWLNSQAVFNVEQEYGNTHYFVGVLEVLVYAVCTIAIFSSSIDMVIVGAYKIGKHLGIDSADKCFQGSVAWNFLSAQDQQKTPREYNTHWQDIQTAMQLATDALNSGEVQNILGVENSIIYSTDLFSTNDYKPGSGFYLVPGQVLKIIEGSARIQTLGEGIAIQKEGSTIDMESSGSSEVSAGDKILSQASTNSSQYAYMQIVSGNIKVNTQVTVAKDSGLLIKEQNQVKLIKGERTIEVDGLLFPYQQLLASNNSNYSSYAYETCQSIANFTSDRKNFDASHDAINLYFNAFWAMALAILGLLLIINLKHSSARTLIFSFIYILASSIIVIFLAAILSNSFDLGFVDWDKYHIYSGDAPIIIALAVFAIFVLIQSLRLIGTKKYKPFAFINFISLPITVAVLISMTLMIKSDLDFDDYLVALSIFFLIYLLLCPLQKKLLVYLITLPKE